MDGIARADSYQPTSHVTRGIYAHLQQAMHTAPWTFTGSGCMVGDDRPHAGSLCLRLSSLPGQRVQSALQQVTFDQTEPRPVKIAGWSRAANVKADKPHHYSIYVDFVFTDGKPWYMKLASFTPGTHGWEYVETIVTPPKPLARATVHVFMREAEGTAWFDDLFVGEARGVNRLLCPGFERDPQIEMAQQNKLFADLATIHVNAIHGYLRNDYEGWMSSQTSDKELLQLLEAARARGIGVWLTPSLRWPTITGANDPNFPQHACVNGISGKRWTDIVARAARFPFAGISVVPDEYTWNNGRLREAYAKHADPRVRQFYQQMSAYCDCPECRQRFSARFGEPFPDRLPTALPSANASYRHWLRFRYDSTTEWISRTVKAVKQVNPGIHTDSLICVSPICSDFWYGPGVAWERLGYEAGLEYPTTDPYILLHNYRGDSTHWYVTETTEHLAAAGPQRRCGVVLEGSRLRREYRELDPVEIYGAALSAVWHGADELAWFHHHCIFGPNPLAPRPEMNKGAIGGVYGLLEKIDPWMDDARPMPGVALLFSRASCDAWRLNVEASDAKPSFDTQGIKEPRFASQVQKEALYLLLRTGVPTTLYYLESAHKEELTPHSVVLVPFPLAIDARRAAMLEELAREGKRVIVCGTDGPLDADANPHAQPALKTLLGGLPRLAANREFAEQALGKGAIVYVAGHFLQRQADSRANENRTHDKRIDPAVIDPQAANAVLHAMASKQPGAQQIAPLMSGRLPDGDDVELCMATNRQGDQLLLAINWAAQARTVALRNDPLLARTPAEAYLLNPDGRWTSWTGSVGRTLKLDSQRALVVRWSNR
jgi:hypothetical protein